jgi:serine/threonine-protein kinase
VDTKKIGAYTIVRPLGSGGMGQVFEAVHDQIQRRAAIKVLHKRFNNNRQIAQRFINEARAVNIVQHPSLVNIYEFGQAQDGSAYIVMEYLNGETLRQRLERMGGKLPPKMAVRLCRQIASALSAAHQKGIIHRDLKPVNIMIVPDSEAAGGERAKVLDFGLAKVMQPDSDGEGSGLTHTGTILGTPAYMAPEQCRSARSVDDKSDVYSLGIILYEMLSSDIPFDSETDAELLSMHMYKAPPPLLDKAPEIPPQLAELVHRMLAKQQSDRPSAAEVADELGRLTIPSAPPMQAALPRAARPIVPNVSDRETLVKTPVGAGASLETRKPSPSATTGETLRQAEQKSSRGLFIGIGVVFVVLAAGGGAVLGWMRGQQLGGAQPRVVSPAAATVHWSVSSIPAGAEVIGADNQVLGRTPLMLENARGVGTAGFIVRAPGYAEARIGLPLDSDEVLGVTLAKLPEGAAPAPAPAPAAAPAVGGGSAPSAEDGGASDAGPQRVEMVD